MTAAPNNPYRLQSRYARQKQAGKKTSTVTGERLKIAGSLRMLGFVYLVNLILLRRAQRFLRNHCDGQNADAA